MRAPARRQSIVPPWRRESLRTNLWFVPAIEVAAAVLLFVVTLAVDQAAADGTVHLPFWMDNGSADAARQILIGIAAAVITVIGLVFSITIVALTLASTQFGPRMLRTFIRDRGVQVTLGTFVATFVFAVLALASVTDDGSGPFVPHFTITVALVLVLVDLGVLIFFIDHVARSIQLPTVIASIAAELGRAVSAETAETAESRAGDGTVDPAEIESLVGLLDREGTPVRAPSSGYLQYVTWRSLVEIASGCDATIRMRHRPGHFVTEGLPLADVWPPATVDEITSGFVALHATGAHRTLSQDLAFAIDQLVEIAIRALSPAVNDTFTGMTCVDWLGDALCKIALRWEPRRVYRPGDRRPPELRAPRRPLLRQDPPGRSWHARDPHPSAGGTHPRVPVRAAAGAARGALAPGLDDRAVGCRQHRRRRRSGRRPRPCGPVHPRASRCRDADRGCRWRRGVAAGP